MRYRGQERKREGLGWNRSGTELDGEGLDGARWDRVKRVRPRQRVGQQESCLLMSCEFYVVVKLLCSHVGLGGEEGA
ncbi:hypothetical protein E2C01_089944 [Portunus trituberculatus]|uniref:Uncharacterized protein n=1 Tax=Portunus trituberculatus TaxID=210409 RepID=A0A5B7JDD9_PORTR|nr:hypothetical protein [Portunus trituberculatus]